MQQKSVWQLVKDFLHDRFDLSADTADQDEVHDNIQKSVEFRGTNLWILIFATVIASVGLNINSAAVIIGAMLISPLMGPITGVGYSLSVNDFELLKKSLKNFVLAISISLVASTLYFLITPLDTAQSEILARTNPSTWDVFVAIFGGLAGFVASSRKEKNLTVIPGVAIATALMPPLCTAGFGLATMQLEFLAGAIYLFFINAVFIAIATFVVVRLLKYKRKAFVDPKKERRMKRYAVLIMVVAIAPSVVMTYHIVQETLFNTAAKRFTRDFFNSGVTNLKFDPERGNAIEVTMVVPLPSDSIAFARGRMEFYGLKNTNLVVNQASDSVSDNSLKYLLTKSTDVLLDKDRKIEELHTQLRYYTQDTVPVRDIAREIGRLIKGIESVVISEADRFSTKGDVISKKLLCHITMQQGHQITTDQYDMVFEWLSERANTTELDLVVDTDKRKKETEIPPVDSTQSEEDIDNEI